MAKIDVKTECSSVELDDRSKIESYSIGKNWKIFYINYRFLKMSKKHVTNVELIGGDSDSNVEIVLFTSSSMLASNINRI